MATVIAAPHLLWLWRHWPRVMMVLPVLGLLLLAGGLVTAEGQFGSGLVSFLTYATCWMLGFAHHDGLLQKVRMRTVVLAGALVSLALTKETVLAPT